MAAAAHGTRWAILAPALRLLVRDAGRSLVRAQAILSNCTVLVLGARLTARLEQAHLVAGAIAGQNAGARVRFAVRFLGPAFDPEDALASRGQPNEQRQQQHESRGRGCAVRFCG